MFDADLAAELEGMVGADLAAANDAMGDFLAAEGQVCGDHDIVSFAAKNVVEPVAAHDKTELVAANDTVELLADHNKLRQKILKKLKNGHPQIMLGRSGQILILWSF